MPDPQSARDSVPSAGIALLPLLFFISGAVALVYEIIWQRQFALLFGSGAPATAAVLAAYFAGLGAGALLAGRLARRWSRPLRAYAGLELLIGAGALLVSPLLAWFETGYPWLYAALADRPAWFMAARLTLAFGVLLIPTVCMGGTLPLLGRLVDHRRRQLGLTAGWLYVVNTLGAGCGALAVPFLLLPGLGLGQTVWLCAALNGLLAAAAWWLDREAGSVASAPAAEPQTQPARDRTNPAGPVLLPALVSGFVTFALQVLWNRAFAQVHENSMYSFAVIVAVVIFALAIGAQLARLGLRRGLQPHRLIGGAWVAAGLAVAVGPWLFLRLSHGLGYLPAGGGATGHAPQLVGLAAMVLLVPLALLGIGLPAIMEQAGRGSDDDAARVLGRLLAANVAGSITGALAAGFLLPPWLGLWNGMFWLGALLLAAGLGQWLHRADAGTNRRTRFILTTGWIASLLLITQADLPRVHLSLNRDERLVSLAEGTHGITAVTERSGSRRLKLNNHYALGGTASTGDERMQAHVPLLLHPAPRRVAFLGLGTGISAGGALFHPVQRVTVMELVPEVAEAARAHFRDANAGVLDDARTVLVADDARHYLRGSGERFDVIVGDLVVPWRQGEGSLFTLEQFTAARAALAEGGLFCQWLPLFQLSKTQTRILVRTFLAVFPRAQVWRGDFSPTAPAIALVGTVGGTAPDPAVVSRRLAEMSRDPANPQLPDIFWMNFVGLLETADLPADETRLNREDRPWVELLASMENGTEDYFTGRRSQAWLEQIRLRPAARGAPLPAAPSAAVAAGAELAELTLCLQEGNQAGAHAAQARLEKLLPATVYRSLFP